MDLSERAYSRCVDLIYAAVDTSTNWRAFYEEVRACTGAESVHMLGFDRQHNALSYSDGANLPTEGELAYMQRYRRIDPRFALIMGTPSLEWVHCHEHFDERFVASDPFYQEFLIPHERRYMSGTKVVDDPHAVVIFFHPAHRATGAYAARSRGVHGTASAARRKGSAHQHAQLRLLEPGTGRADAGEQVAAARRADDTRWGSDAHERRSRRFRVPSTTPCASSCGRSLQLPLPGCFRSRFAIFRCGRLGQTLETEFL